MEIFINFKRNVDLSLVLRHYQQIHCIPPHAAVEGMDMRKGGLHRIKLFKKDANS